MSDVYVKELKVAIETARKAGLMLIGRRGSRIESSVGKDIKLFIDKESEKLIINDLRQFGFSILSEEYGFEDKGTSLCWIVDPLDGSMNYSKGLDDMTCVSIALWNEDEPIFGIVYRYKVDEMFWGVIGEGAFLNGEPIKPSNVNNLSQAVLGTGFPIRTNYDDSSLLDFVRDVQVYKKIRMLGAAALMATFVACGRLDAYKEENVMIWDIAAAVAIDRAVGCEVELEMREDYKCICKCFANLSLKDLDGKVSS